jgi:hypothetical protein
LPLEPATSTLPEFMASIATRANKRVQFGYGLNYLIDIENAIIVDVTRTML